MAIKFLNNVAVDSDVLYVDTASNRVGIGTTSPGYKLDVNGSFHSTNITIADSIYHEGDTDTRFGFVGNDTIRFYTANSEKFYIASTSIGSVTTHDFLSTLLTSNVTGRTDTDTKIQFPGSNVMTFTTGNSERMRITSTGNVGIGVTNPSRKLYVAGGDVYAPITSDTAGAGSFGGNSFEIRNSTTGEHFNLDIYNRTTSTWYTPFHIQNTGNVGIGTTSPSYKLDVYGDSTSGIVRVKNAANGRDTFRSENAAGARTFNVGNDASGHGNVLVRNSSGTTTNYISGSGNSYFNAGNVGIGTTSPVEKLDVAGNINTTGDIIVDSSHGFSNSGPWTRNATPYGYIDFGPANTSYAHIYTDRPYFYFNKQLQVLGGIVWNSGNDGSGSGLDADLLDGVHGGSFLRSDAADTFSGDLSNGTSGASISLGYDVSSINNTIGTSGWFRSSGATGWYNGTYGGGIYMTDSTWVRVYNDKKFYVNNGAFFAGNVGIGDTAPDATLTVFRTSTTFATALNTAESRAGLSVKSTSTYDAKLTISTGTSGVQQVQGVNNAATTGRDIAINPYGGNVGIGTPAPSKKLHVEGTVRADSAAASDWAFLAYNNLNTASSGIWFDNGDGELLLRDDANNLNVRLRSDSHSYFNGGNVGIGTTSPSNKLDVNGNIEASRIILPTAGTSGSGTVTAPAGKLDIRSDSTWSNSAIIARSTTNQNPVLAFYRPTGSAAISYPWWLEANGSTFQIKTGSAANIGSESVSSKVTINSSGNVGIGTTNPGYKLEVIGDIYSSAYITANSGLDCYGDFYLTGYATMESGAEMYGQLDVYDNVYANAYFTNSDESLKTNIQELPGNAVNVNWKSFEFKEKQGETRVGVIAQELEQNHPEFVSTSKTGFKTVNYIELLIAKIAELETRIKQLENNG